MHSTWDELCGSARCETNGLSPFFLTECFVDILHSKLNPYRGDFLVYLRVMNSSHNVFSCGLPRIINTHCICFFIASLSRLAGYNKTYTTCVVVFSVNHSNPLCKLFLHGQCSSESYFGRVLHFSNQQCGSSQTHNVWMMQFREKYFEG